MGWPIFWVLVVLVALYLLRYGKLLFALWKEPVLRVPVVIFESDDWGPAEDPEAAYLREIIAVLARYRDSRGRHPVMTLGVVLSVPDSARIHESGVGRYFDLRFDDPRFRSIRDAIDEGVQAGVFSIQLHGLAHYQPDVVLEAAGKDDRVAEWVEQEAIPDARALPDGLQSRWIDGSVQPSRALAADKVFGWAVEEVELFREIFGVSPRVIVPPTFIWNDAAERGWSDVGVRYLVTPGQRFESRDDKGCPVAVGVPVRNAQRAPDNGLIYLVRDRYFEPSLGHTATDVLDAAKSQWEMRRPTLFETHRFNFNGTAADRKNALGELDRALELLLQSQPQVMFLSSEELGECLYNADPLCVESSFVQRVVCFQKRVRREMPLIRRLFPV